MNTTPGRAVNIEGIRGGADGNGPLAIQPGIRQRADLTGGQSPAQSRAAQGPGGPLMSLRPFSTPAASRPTPVHDPGPNDPFDVEARFNRETPAPKETSANKAVRFASERRKARNTESKRSGILEHLRKRKGAYGIGAAIGGGVGLAGAGVYAYNQPREEQY